MTKSEYAKLWWAKNKDKRRQYNKAYREKNPERYLASKKACYQKYKEKRKQDTLRWQRLNPKKVKLKKWRQAGIINFNWSDFDRLCINQLGMCAMCGNRPLEVVDHDHDTGLVRGLLCDNCNKGLGLIGDDLESAMKAVNYLKVGK